jgi:hypothetical protein
MESLLDVWRWPLGCLCGQVRLRRVNNRGEFDEEPMGEEAWSPDREGPGEKGAHGKQDRGAPHRVHNTILRR